MTNLKRKFLVFFLAMLCAFCLAFGLTACDTDGDTTDPNNTDQGDGEGENPSTPNTPSTGDNDDDDDENDTEITVTELSGITLTIKDVSIAIPIYSYNEDTYEDTYVDSSTAGTLSASEDSSVDSTMTATFEAGELDIVLGMTESGDYTLLLYASGDIVIDMDGYTMVYAADLYGNGVKAYILYAGTSMYSDGTEVYSSINTTAVTVSYDYLFDTIETELMSNDELMTYVTAITEGLEGYLAGETTIDESVLSVITTLSGYSESAATMLGNIVGSLFTVTDITNGSVATFDITAIQTLVKDAYELTTSALVDKYLGEGTYASIINYISSIGSKTISTYITDTANGIGIETDTLYAVINYVVEQITGESFDIASVLTSTDGSYEDLLAILNMTVDQVLTEAVGTDTTNIAAYLNEISSQTLFIVIFYDETEAASAYATINSVLTEIAESVTFTITGTTDGLLEVLLSVNEFTINGITANGVITITSEASIPENATDVKSSVKELYVDFAEVVTAALTNGKYEFEDGGYITIEGSYAVYTKDGVSYTLSSSADNSYILIEKDGDYHYFINVTNYSSLTNTEIQISLYIGEDESGNAVYELSTQTYKYTYDANGKLTSYRNEDSDGWYYTYSYEYDANGNTTKYHYENSNDYYFTQTYEYNADGNVTKEYYESSDGSSSTTTYTWENGYCVAQKYENSYGDSSEYTYIRDENGNATYTKEVHTYTDGSYYSTYTYEYYREYTYTNGYWSGITTKMIRSHEDSNNYSYTHTYEYDADGNITKESYEDSYGDSYTTTYTYNDNGDVLTEETVYSDTKSYSITYEYDEDYNLITETSIGKQIEDEYTYTYTYTTSYVYDANGNRQYASYNEEYKTEYTDGITETQTETYTSTFTYTYTENGIFASGTYTNSDGDTGTFTFNDLGWITKEEYYNSDEEFIYSYTYEYNIIWEDDYDNCTEYYVYITITCIYANSEGGTYSTTDYNYEFFYIYY